MPHGVKVGLEAVLLAWLIDSLPISGFEMYESRNMQSSELASVIESHGGRMKPKACPSRLKVASSFRVVHTLITVYVLWLWRDGAESRRLKFVLFHYGDGNVERRNADPRE